MNSENNNISDKSEQMPQETNTIQSANKKKLTTTQKILIMGICIIVIAIGVIGIFIWQKLNQPEEVIQPNKNYIITDENAESISNLIQEEVADGMYRVNMNTNWTFEDGNNPSINAYVANADTNTKDVYISVELNDGQLIYESGIIPVGSALKSIKLDTPLDAGTYDGICTYHLLDNDQNEISTLSVFVQLTIKN